MPLITKNVAEILFLNLDWRVQALFIFFSHLIKTEGCTLTDFDKFICFESKF